MDDDWHDDELELELSAERRLPGGPSAQRTAIYAGVLAAVVPTAAVAGGGLTLKLWVRWPWGGPRRSP